jgi:hypothetical protein
MIFVGIDNGLNGAVVAIDEKEEIVFKSVMPIVGKPKEYDVQNLTYLFEYQIFAKDKYVYVGVEKAHVRPVSGARASFMTGKGYGVIQGVLGALGYGYEIITPQKWQKAIIGSGSKDIKPSIKYCQRKYPKEDFTATERSKKPHDGITDALVIAIYMKRKHLGEIK